jgi:hypothetical protein
VCFLDIHYTSRELVALIIGHKVALYSEDGSSNFVPNRAMSNPRENVCHCHRVENLKPNKDTDRSRTESEGGY